MFAIFFEFHRDQDLFQGLFIPATLLGTSEILPTLAYREMPIGRRRTWQVARTPKSQYQIVPDDYDRVEDLIANEINQFESISSIIVSPTSDPSWELKAAFPVPIENRELLELKENPLKLPMDINVRVNALREQKGLPR